MPALVGWSAVTGGLELPALVLYAAGIVWTLGYDTIYAHQDREDDAMVGIRSSALTLGEPVNATRQAMADGSTVSKLAWTLEQLVGVHSHKLRQPVERVKVRFDAEEGDYAGRGAEVLVDPSQTCPRIELIFDRMLDTPDARGWVVSVLNAAACMLAGGHQSQLQQQPVAHTEGLGDEREPGTAAGAAA